MLDPVVVISEITSWYYNTNADVFATLGMTNENVYDIAARATIS